jgi:acyl-CoA thioesterase-1
MQNLRPVIVLLLLITLCCAPVASSQPDEPVILVLGDSISAGYGIKLSQGWVSLLEQRLLANGFPHRVVNASISGDTSRGGLARLPDALDRHRPNLVILELGGNDGLRGLNLRELEKNMAAMIELSQQSGARVLIAEMRIPPNYGPRYTEKFQALFRELAERYQATLIPFMLNGVATNPALMQQDGIHPRANAQPVMLNNVWRALEPLLKTS